MRKTFVKKIKSPSIRLFQKKKKKSIHFYKLKINTPLKNVLGKVLQLVKCF